MAARWSFQPIDRPFGALAAKATRELLAKWTMLDSMRATSFRFDQPFQSFEMADFLRDFFNDQEVTQRLEVLATVRGKWAAVGPPGQCESVGYKEVSCTAVSMEFFDRLYQVGAVRADDGSLKQCMPDYLDSGFVINHEVGRVMLLEDSDDYDTFSGDDRNELIFKIFKHLTLGGPLNQYEDSIGPYFDTTKLFYKSLINVAKSPKTGKVQVTSVCADIRFAEGLSALFPQEGHPQNFCYAVISPTKREVTIWYHAWCG